MKDYSKKNEGYVRTSKAWYNSFNNDRLSFGIYNSDGIFYKEIVLEWVELDECKKLKIECYQDSLDLMTTYNHIIKKIIKKDNITESEVVKILDLNLFDDLTTYQNN